MNYIPWIISFCSLIVAILSLAHTSNKDRTNEIREDTEKFDSIEKSLLKANIKLDTVCSTTTETRADIKSLNTDLKNSDFVCSDNAPTMWLDSCSGYGSTQSLLVHGNGKAYVRNCAFASIYVGDDAHMETY